MDTYDVFSQGVEPGGLRSKNDIKTLICYLVSRLDTPITKEQLNTIVSEEGLANYFDLNQALSELLQNANVSMEIKGTDEILTITTIGKANAAELENTIPYTVREKAFNAAIRLQTRLRREREHKIEIQRLDEGCNITISISDSDGELLSVRLYTADYEQALAVKEKFLADPVKIYSNIIALLMA